MPDVAISGGCRVVVVVMMVKIKSAATPALGRILVEALLLTQPVHDRFQRHPHPRCESKEHAHLWCQQVELF